MIVGKYKSQLGEFMISVDKEDVCATLKEIEQGTELKDNYWKYPLRSFNT
jgi:hypothetical protein